MLAVSISCGSDTGPSPTYANYAGNWTGAYSVSFCNQSGGMALASLCSQVAGTLPFSVSLNQARNYVSGSFALGNLNFPGVSGTVNGNALVFSGTATVNSITMVVTWTLSSPLAGTLTQVWTSPTVSGAVNVSGVIVRATR